MTNKKDYDLSDLTLEQLIEVYKNIEEYLKTLKESKIEIEKKDGKDE